MFLVIRYYPNQTHPKDVEELTPNEQDVVSFCKSKSNCDSALIEEKKHFTWRGWHKQ